MWLMCVAKKDLELLLFHLGGGFMTSLFNVTREDLLLHGSVR